MGQLISVEESEAVLAAVGAKGVDTSNDDVDNVEEDEGWVSGRSGEGKALEEVMSDGHRGGSRAARLNQICLLQM